MNKKEEILDKIKEFLKENGFEFIDTYTNGESGFWGFNKDRDLEVSFKLNELPNDEDIENFEEQIKYIEDLKERKD